MLAKSLCVAVRAEQLLVTVIAEKIQCSSRMTSLTHLHINYVTFHCVESLFRLIIE